MNYGNRNYTCDICHRQFLHLHHLKSHLNSKKQCGPQEKIKNKDPIICQYCNKEFARKDNLSTHLKKKDVIHFLSNSPKTVTWMFVIWVPKQQAISKKK